MAARREVEVLRSLDHSNVVAYRGACLEARGHLLLVMVCPTRPSRPPPPPPPPPALNWLPAGGPEAMDGGPRLPRALTKGGHEYLMDWFPQP